MIEIDIIHEGGIWPKNASDIIKKGIEAVLNHEDIRHAEASVVLADNSFVQTLNKEYRNKNKPTNVLSFPQTLPILGDSVFAYETIEHEAKEQGKAFDDHLMHLIIHSTLHLLGYDHENDQDAETMETLEIKILTSMKIRNPYA